MDPQELLTDLSRPDAFPEAGPSVKVVQTHISLVFLTGERVYKVKKSLSLWGLLDYGTPARRRAMCLEEVRVNRRLAPNVYLGVLPIVSRDGRLRVVADARDDDALDWAVVMRRLPEHATLAAAVAAGTATAAEVADVARLVARFHDDARLPPALAARPLAFARVLRQNFLATHAVADRLGPALHAWLHRRVGRLLRDARATLHRRRLEGRTVDGHGDLRAEHVVRDARPGATGEPPLAHVATDVATPVGTHVVIDAIEFAPALRRIDPLADAAFLAMDLAALGRADLSDAFLAAYLAARPDADADALLPLYLAYRAHVRTKVDAHRAGEAEVPAPDRAAAWASARHHLAVAWSFARTGTPPPLVVLVGLSGSGKSAVARALRRALRAEVVASDVERKRLLGLEPTARMRGEARARLYAEATSRATYDRLVARAREGLRAGRPVVLDATFLLASARRAAVEAAHAVGCPAVLLCVEVPEATARARIEARAGQGLDPSDATVEVYAAQRAEFEPVGPDEADVVVPHDGTAPPEGAVTALLEALCRREDRAGSGPRVTGRGPVA